MWRRNCAVNVVSKQHRHDEAGKTREVLTRIWSGEGKSLRPKFKRWQRWWRWRNYQKEASSLQRTIGTSRRKLQGPYYSQPGMYVCLPKLSLLSFIAYFTIFWSSRMGLFLLLEMCQFLQMGFVSTLGNVSILADGFCFYSWKCANSWGQGLFSTVGNMPILSVAFLLLLIWLLYLLYYFLHRSKRAH